MQVQGLENVREKHDSKQRRLIKAWKEIHNTQDYFGPDCIPPSPLYGESHFFLWDR